jgi:hypothetical protein
MNPSLPELIVAIVADSSDVDQVSGVKAISIPAIAIK